MESWDDLVHVNLKKNHLFFLSKEKIKLRFVAFPEKNLEHPIGPKCFVFK